LPAPLHHWLVLAAWPDFPLRFNLGNTLVTYAGFTFDNQNITEGRCRLLAQSMVGFPGR
jgi:hypothetical protein